MNKSKIEKGTTKLKWHKRGKNQLVNNMKTMSKKPKISQVLEEVMMMTRKGMKDLPIDNLERRDTMITEIKKISRTMNKTKKMRNVILAIKREIRDHPIEMGNSNNN